MRPERAKTRQIIDSAALERLAIHYVSRYATSTAKLQRYLLRKLYQQEPIANQGDVITAIVDKMVAAGYVEDSAFAAARGETLQRRGYGEKRINAALRQAGIDETLASQVLTHLAPEADAAMHRYAKRRRLGPYSLHAPTDDSKRRVVATLIRAGHNYQAAQSLIESWEKGSLADGHDDDDR